MSAMSSLTSVETNTLFPFPIFRSGGTSDSAEGQQFGASKGAISRGV